MGTRSIWTFADTDFIPEKEHHVYKHWDGYPEGASAFLIKTLLSERAWALPRWEADEFAAAFIAANKEGPGDIRLSSGRHDACDVEYGYTLWSTQKGTLSIRAVRTDYWSEPREELVFEGSLLDFLEGYPAYYAVKWNHEEGKQVLNEGSEGWQRWLDEMRQLKEAGLK
jgi:hypothetical protein